MDNRDQLNKQIVLTLMTIQEKHPELIKYLDESPAQGQSLTNTEIDITNLKSYLDSLNELLETYSQRQDSR